MSTAFVDSELSAALFGQTRRAILALLYGHPDQSYYFRQLVRSAGLGLGAAQREVKHLSEAGVIRRTVSGHQVFYQANPDCPIFGELKGLMVKTTKPDWTIAFRGDQMYASGRSGNKIGNPLRRATTKARVKRAMARVHR